MITVYSKPNCGGCSLVKNALERNSIPYTEKDVTQDEEAMDFVVDNGFSSLPITDIKGILVNGYAPIELVKALGVAGYEITL